MKVDHKVTTLEKASNIWVLLACERRLHTTAVSDL